MFLRQLIKNTTTLSTKILNINPVNRLAVNEIVKLRYSTEEKISPVLDQKLINITFVKSCGEKIKVKGKIGESLLDVVCNNNIDLDGFGACEGTLTCSTCHLIFSEKDYNELPDRPCVEEIDMLELANDLTETSRLGCQIILSEKMDGLEILVPACVMDARDN